MTPNTKMAPMWPNLPAPKFMGRVAKIVEQVRTKTCIDNVDTEAIEKILQDELNEYCRMLDGYYAEEYYNAITSAQHRAYDEGHSDGYSLGYDDGYLDGHSAV